MTEATALRLEYVVRRKIGEKGFEGAHMFEEAFNENLGTVEKIFDHYGFKIAMELNGQ